MRPQDDADQVMMVVRVVQRVPGRPVQHRRLAEDADLNEETQRAVDGGAPQARKPR